MFRLVDNMVNVVVSDDIIIDNNIIIILLIHNIMRAYIVWGHTGCG